jgi:hypothetical protein
VCRDVLEAVAPQLRILMAVEEEKFTRQRMQQHEHQDRQSQAVTATWSRQDAADITKACLLDVGGLVEGSGWPAWVGDTAPDAATLWQFVAKASGYRIGGQQLANLYRSIKQHHDRQQSPCHHCPDAAGASCQPVRQSIMSVASIPKSVVGVRSCPRPYVPCRAVP